jgi:hypothetical protein
MFNAYQDAEGNWSKFEVSSGVGCIAPQSHVRTSAGDYFLSQRGIELENEGGQLERFYSSKPVSLMLNNFTKLPIEHKRRAVGAWIPRENKVLWSISTPTWDTTYVFDELVGGWVTWSLKYRAWTLYDTTTGTSDGPGDAFYFVPPGSSKLCRYHTKDITSSTFGDAIIDYEPTTSGLGREPVGSSAALSDTTANAQIVSIYYKSGALLANTYQLTQINRIGMWAMNAVTDPVTGYRNRISFRLLNDKGTVANSGSWMTLDSLSLRYRWKDIIGYPSRYYQIEIAPVTAGTFGNTTIEHIDIWASRKERWR